MGVDVGKSMQLTMMFIMKIFKSSTHLRGGNPDNEQFELCLNVLPDMNLVC